MKSDMGLTTLSQPGESSAGSSNDLDTLIRLLIQEMQIP